MTKTSHYLPLIVLTLFFAACAVVPITSRKQLSFVPPAQLLGLSETNYKQVLETSELSTDIPKTQMVEEVGKKIAQAAEDFLKDNGQEAAIKDYNWQFKLIKEEKTVNAFCLPGGRIVVFTGILPIAKDATGLAVIMGHEVAHALANHGGERLSQQLLVQFGGTSLAKAVSQKPEKTQKIWMSVYGYGAGLGVLMPYSRLHESEADHIGLILMARAGFNPEEAPGFWERMNAAGGGEPPEFLSSHPANKTRIEGIKQVLPDALEYYQA